MDIPTAIASPADVSSWSIVSTGSDHTCGISSVSKLYCWLVRDGEFAGAEVWHQVDVSVEHPYEMRWGVSHAIGLDRYAGV